MVFDLWQYFDHVITGIIGIYIICYYFDIKL